MRAERERDFTGYLFLFAQNSVLAFEHTKRSGDKRDEINEVIVNLIFEEEIEGF